MRAHAPAGDRWLGRLFGQLLLAAALAGVAAAFAQAGLAPRELVLRYALVAAIPLSIAPSHVLLPDPDVPWLQRLNPRPAALLRRQLARWAGVALAAVAPAVALGIWAGSALAAVEGALLVAGVALYAVRDALSLGPVSQDWQEGTRGAAYRQLVERNPQMSFQVPHGLVPVMLASMRVFLVGAGAVLATVAAAALGGDLLGWVPGAALAAWTASRLARDAGTFDRAYYHTSGLFVELLRGGPAAGRADIGYDAVYWVPHRWRPAAWAGLLQLDRRLPLGRLVAIGTLGFWGLLIWGAAPAVVAGYLAITIAARNATILRHADPTLAPPAFDLAQQSVTDWATTRFWMNVRWTLPLALSLAIPAILSAAVGWRDVAFWTGIDLLFAFVTALGATYAAEYRYRRRFA